MRDATNRQNGRISGAKWALTIAGPHDGAKLELLADLDDAAARQLLRERSDAVSFREQTDLRVEVVGAAAEDRLREV